MQFIKLIKLVLYGINFTFSAVIVILINGMNGDNQESKIYEDNHLLYLYVASSLGFLGLQMNGQITISLFMILNVYGLYSSSNIINFYYGSKVNINEKADMWLMVSNYNGSDDSLSTHMHTIQTSLRCCGLRGFKEDYFKKRLPSSCCINVAYDQKCASEKAFKRGCWLAFSNRYYFYKDFNLVLESIVFISQVISIIFSLIFIRELKLKKLTDRSKIEITIV